VEDIVRIGAILFTLFLANNCLAAEMARLITPNKQTDLDIAVKRPAEIVDNRAAISQLLVGRPTIGTGKLNIVVFVDFHEEASRKVLSNLLTIMQKEKGLKVTVIYYAPTRPITDQVAARYSTLLHRAAGNKRHLIYMQNMIKFYGKKNAMSKATLKAKISPKMIVDAGARDNDHSSKIIAENNAIGFRVTHIAKAPIVIIEGKMLSGYLGVKELKHAIAEITLSRGRAHPSSHGLAANRQPVNHSPSSLRP
jgi:protein-disulfide isomerase